MDEMRNLAACAYGLEDESGTRLAIGIDGERILIGLWRPETAEGIGMTLDLSDAFYVGAALVKMEVRLLAEDADAEDLPGLAARMDKVDKILAEMARP